MPLVQFCLPWCGSDGLTGDTTATPATGLTITPAPALPQVLEALNRLLDDNRELLVPELQEVVKPHPHFMLFATQNPPGAYAGRKVLSRAFRSRWAPAAAAACVQACP